MSRRRAAPIPAQELSERDFTTQIRDNARLMGYLRYHTWRSKHSPAGFPDEVLLRPPRLIFAELKAEAGKPTPEQIAWLDQLAKQGVEVYLWRPSMIQDITEHMRPRFRPAEAGPGAWEAV